MDDLPPPPPYSEYDTDSMSISNAAHPDPILTPTSSTLDAPSTPGGPVPESDDDSSIGDPFYTPPYTPESPKDAYHPGALGRDSDSLASSISAIAASAYFESRSVDVLSTDTLLIHNIVVTRDTRPTDLLFPQPEEGWLERDVLPVDWQTFVNYLIPHHVKASNNGVADRKIRAELIDEGMSSLTLAPEGSSRANLNSVEAQLEPLRRSHAGQRTGADISSIVQSWNEGFFGPRGLLIEASVSDVDEVSKAMPGSWTDYPANVSANPCNNVPRGRFGRGFRGSWIRPNNSGFHIGKNFLSADENGFRMGKRGLVADTNGFRIGNFLVADAQGFKLGPIKADGYGFRIGRPDRAPHVQQESYQGCPPRPCHTSILHASCGRGQDAQTSESTQSRHRSSSVSSSASSDSSSSFQSVGSLPDYDHLDHGQLPIARQALSEWLRHPEQIITKETVNKAREQLKAAKGQKPSRSEEDRNALKLEVCELLKQFRTLRKEQKQRWRAAGWERWAARRTAKHARRDAKHQSKHAAKQARRHCKREIRDGKRSGCHSSRGSIPGILPSVLPQDSAFAEMAPTDSAGRPSMANSPHENLSRPFELQRDGARIGKRDSEKGLRG